MSAATGRGSKEGATENTTRSSSLFFFSRDKFWNMLACAGVPQEENVVAEEGEGEPEEAREELRRKADELGCRTPPAVCGGCCCGREGSAVGPGYREKKPTTFTSCTINTPFLHVYKPKNNGLSVLLVKVSMAQSDYGALVLISRCICCAFRNILGLETLQSARKLIYNYQLSSHAQFID